MQQQLQMVEFGVAGLEDVRTLLRRWKQVPAELAREEAPSMVLQTHRQVGVEVEDRRPGEEVLLTFLAPPSASRWWIRRLSSTQDAAMAVVFAAPPVK